MLQPCMETLQFSTRVDPGKTPTFRTRFEVDCGALTMRPLLFYYGQAENPAAFVPRCLAPSNSAQFQGLIQRFKHVILRTHGKTGKRGRHMDAITLACLCFRQVSSGIHCNKACFRLTVSNHLARSKYKPHGKHSLEMTASAQDCLIIFE